MKMKNAFIIGCLALGAFACADKNNDGKPDGLQNQQQGPEFQLRNFASQCRNFDAITGLHQKTIYDFDVTGFTHTVEFFSDDNCQSSAGNFKFDGTYALEDVDGKDYDNIDFTYETVEISASSQAGADALNFVNYCGKNDWKTGDTLDATNIERGPTCILFFDTPGTYFDIVKTEEQDNGPTRVYFGSGFLGPKSTEADRVTTLNTNIEYLAE